MRSSWWKPLVTDLLEAQLEELRVKVKALEEERSRSTMEAVRWQTRYEELARWLERDGPQRGVPASPHGAFSAGLDQDPFAEVPEEKARLTRLFLEDPAAAMAEAAGDGMGSDFAAEGTLESAR
mgnify:CR=1 FL=1